MRSVILTMSLLLALSITPWGATAQQPSGQQPSPTREENPGHPFVPRDTTRPLSPEARRIAFRARDEGTATPDEHYVGSNEWRHELWFPHIRDIGGGYIGVGADQNYTLAAVQNARMVWLVDFDPYIPMVHRLYMVLIPRSDSAEALVAHFQEDRERATVQLIETAMQNDPHREAVVRLYRRQRARMARYLRVVHRGPHRERSPTWLNRPELYTRVRNLFLGGRIATFNGDVTSSGALRAVGRSACELGVTVRVVYFSNAEQFFPYRSDFVRNVFGIPTDRRSVYLRTFRHRRATYPDGERWHYVVQPASDFIARLTAGYRHSRWLVHDLLSNRGALGEEGVSVLDSRLLMRHGPVIDRREERGQAAGSDDS